MLILFISEMHKIIHIILNKMIKVKKKKKKGNDIKNM